MAVGGLRKELLGEGAAPMAAKLHLRLPLFRAMGVGSLALELLAPLALARPRLARVWAVGTFQMLWGILVIVGIKFRYQLCGLILAPFFDVGRLTPSWLRRRRER